jgi:phospholipid/cholesterol/gamma-HCH transport system substrate-binding protein
MSAGRAAGVNFGVFAVVMTIFAVFLFMIFGQWRTGPAAEYSAVFADSSQLSAGDSVRAAGLRVGTVRAVELQADGTVLVDFEAGTEVSLTEGSKVAVRYLNLVGDRYLELVNVPGSTRLLPAHSRIPVERTIPALDLDVLLGGLKPVIQGLNPRDVNALTASLIEVFQGQGDVMQSLLSRTSSFSAAMADNGHDIDQMLDALNVVMRTVATKGDQFSGAIDRLARLMSELSQQRDPIGAAIDSLSAGTSSMADLLSQARPPLTATIEQLNRLAPILDDRKDVLDGALKKAPDNYRKLTRLGSYGSWINYYICGLSVRVTDLQGETALFPWIKQEGGRCAES